MLRHLSKLINLSGNKLPLQFIRNGHRLRGKKPGEAKSLAQFLEELNYVDPEIAEKINIGFSLPKKSRKGESAKELKLFGDKNSDSNFEKAARTAQVDTAHVKKEWLQADASRHIQMAAEHYGVFQDLFGDAFFTPLVNLDVTYEQIDGKLAPVYRGNVVKPAESITPPQVNFHSRKDSLWTLILTNPDGHLTEENKEYVHWFIGNIPGNDISKGEVVWDYLQPFPPLGIGFQRFIFILYKQEKLMDFSDLKKSLPCRELSERTFDTQLFYRSRQNDLTPAGLAFFQSDWDASVRETFHKILNMEQPKFEYDFTTPYIAPPKWFARRKPFNVYLDKYRDPRDIAKDFLLKKLAALKPFERPQKPFPYSNIYKVDRTKTPSWLLTEGRRVKLGLGRINNQKDDFVEP